MPLRIFFSSRSPSECPQSDATQADRHFCRRRRRLQPADGRDEAGTLRRLRANRQTIFEPQVAQHGGRRFENDTSRDPIRSDERDKALIAEVESRLAASEGMTTPAS
jgi:hypothetical protein